MKYKFKDLIDIPKLQELTDELYACTSIPSSIVDIDGEILTGSGQQKICTDFHRKHPESQKECRKSDSAIIKKLNDGESYVIYNCPRGLIDASSPIIVNGEHVANVFSGQVFLAPPDYSVELFFKKQAKRFGFHVEEYMKAFKEIPVFTEEKFRSGIFFLSKLSNIVANIGMSRLNEIKSMRALKENEAKYRSLFENMMNGFALHQIVTTDQQEPVDYIFLDVNSAFEELTGLKKQDIIGRKVTDALPGTEKDPANWIGRYGDVALTGRAIRFEQFSEAIDKWFSILAFSPQKGQFATVFQDITERKRSEAELKETKQLLERTQAITKLGGWEYNIENRQLIWTDEVFRIHGIETIKNPVDLDSAIACYGPQNAALIKQSLQCAIEKAESYNIEIELTRADGEKIWVRTMGQPVLKNGKVVKVTGNIWDISDRKQADLDKEKLQARLLQAQKMESIGTLAGGIAHDFNNILSIIIGNTELALEDVPNWNPAFNNIQEIKTASFRARDVVKQLLSFSRKSKEEQKPIDIAPIVQESLKLIRSSIPTSIKIKEFITDSADTILADATQIHQVIINLCTNAAHAMLEEQGIIEVSLETVCIEKPSADKFKKLPQGKYINLVVKDTGTGMNQETIEKIFDPYFTTKAVGKGTGMGLAVVHGIVKNHNAHIFVDSTPGTGTTFNIVFPTVADQAKQKSEESHAETKSSGKETILFVDDEASLVEMAKLILTKLGYGVEISTNPIKALALFEKNPKRFDLVISDMTMPQMSGVKFSEQLKKIRSDIPIIICTGHSSLIDEEKAKNLGISAFVMKPIPMSEIAKLIRGILEK